MDNNVTADFREEFRTQRDTWLRRRYVYYALAMIVINVFGAIANLLVAWAPLEYLRAYLDETEQQALAVYTSAPYLFTSSGFLLAMIILYAWTARYVAARKPDRWTVLRIVYWIFITVQVSGILITTAGILFIDDAIYIEQLHGTVTRGLMVSYALVCLFIPWTPREAVRPVIPIVLLGAILLLVFNQRGPWDRFVAIVPVAASCIPGLMICAWRDYRFRRRFDYHMLKTAFVSMRHELELARRIHDQCFPTPIHTGPVRFEYAYRPAKQLGGDFLTVIRHGEQVGLIVVDVTGHGIAAALAVNRLLGEIARLTSTGKATGPGEMLAGLNEYVHANYTDHSVFATAFIAWADPTANTLRWASAGHPPAFCVRPGEQLAPLDSTSIVLGALGNEAFKPAAQTISFPAGSAVFIYTDGAMEARPRDGKMLSAKGLQDIIGRIASKSDGPCSKSILAAVDQYRAGRCEDDTLIAELHHVADRSA